MSGNAVAAAAMIAVALLPSTGVAQVNTSGAQPPPGVERPQDVPAPATIDVFDLWRQLRHKESPQAGDWDYRKPMIAFAPVIGAKPSSGMLLGAAGNVAFYRGDPATTHISSAVASVTFSTKKQTAITNRLTTFGRDDRWRLDADHRFQWTSLETHALGTSADTRDGVDARFDFFRLHHTAYYRLRPALFAGAGLYFDNHVSVGPSEDGEAEWADSPYVQYSTAHDLPLESQTSAGTSLDLLWDSRDSFINADRGSLARVSYRLLFDGFLGGESNWQKLTLDFRTYRPLSSSGRHKLAAWVWADLVVDGAAPYLDLPATGTDTYGRSGRGYSEGQFRGERLAYGEIEYRGALTRNGLLGMVAFLNTTTVTNLASDEHLFDSFATGAGAGLRLLINKRSKTNLCFDIGFGKQGSRGVYLGVQEAF
jgi:Omp85 superfamily domain